MKKLTLYKFINDVNMSNYIYNAIEHFQITPKFILQSRQRQSPNSYNHKHAPHQWKLPTNIISFLKPMLVYNEIIIQNITTLDINSSGWAGELNDFQQYLTIGQQFEQHLTTTIH